MYASSWCCFYDIGSKSQGKDHSFAISGLAA
jgi:hypothetical protein